MPTPKAEAFFSALAPTKLPSILGRLADALDDRGVAGAEALRARAAALRAP